MNNKFLSLDWFKSKVENSIDRVIASKLEKMMEEEPPVETPVLKPFLRVQLVNDTLTVVLNDGSIVTKPEATEEDFHAVNNAKTENEIRTILSSSEIVADIAKVKAEEAKIRAIQKGIQLLADLDDFTVEGNTVYLKGTSRSLPQLLVERFIEVIGTVGEEPADCRSFQQSLNEDEDYMALKNFFMWCCLNPRAEVAHELYRFLNENSFRITKQGFVVALRNVVTLHGSPELVHFISNTYNKVKAVWKKNPDNYTVFLENEEYKLVHDSALMRTETHNTTTCPDCLGDGGLEDQDNWEDEWMHCETCEGGGEVEEYTTTEEWSVNHGEKIGKLTELYLDLPNREENRFTDDWTKTFDIRIGQVTSMPQEDCNWSTQDCAAAGLHFTADQIHYVGCGDQSVIVIINPMKIVGIGQHKGRCFEYLPIMTVPREEATGILHDGMFDTLQLDEEYAIRELESLLEKAKEGFAVESKKYEFNMPSISAKEINAIVLTLNEMKAKIATRVNTIK
jgi:hypothetical protein